MKTINVTVSDLAYQRFEEFIKLINNTRSKHRNGKKNDMEEFKYVNQHEAMNKILLSLNQVKEE